MAEESQSSKKCFLIGPIGRKGEEANYHADLLLNYIVKNVLEGEPFSYEVIRADQADDPGMVLTRIVNDIFDADLIVADLSFRNANVFWELGIAHTIRKPVICFKRPEDVVPFDLDQHRVIAVNLGDWHSHEAARELLASYAAKIGESEYRPSNPVTQARDHYELQSSGDPQERVIAKLEERLDAQAATLNAMLNRISGVEAKPASFFGLGANISSDFKGSPGFFGEQGDNQIDVPAGKIFSFTRAGDLATNPATRLAELEAELDRLRQRVEREEVRDKDDDDSPEKE